MIVINETTPINMIHVLYPQDIHVPEDTILGWAHDAMVNEAVDDYVKQNGLISEDADGDLIHASIANAHPRPTDVDAAIELLDGLGTHTFEKRS